MEKYINLYRMMYDHVLDVMICYLNVYCTLIVIDISYNS